MHQHFFLRVFGLFRVALGLWMIAAPQRLAELWFGEGDHPPSIGVLVRSVGGRDVALGLGLAADPTADSAWLPAGIISDLVDAGAILLARDHLPRRNFLNGFLGGLVYSVIGTAVLILGRGRAMKGGGAQCPR